MDVNKTGFNENRLLDSVRQLLGVKNDAALARALQVAPPVISKIRHGKAGISGDMLIRMHEETALSIRELRTLMGDACSRWQLARRMSASPRLKQESPQAQETGKKSA